MLRTIAREMDKVSFPKKEEDLLKYLSVKYSMPENLVTRWLDAYGEETTEKILADFLTERPLTIRCRTYLNSKEEIVKSLENQGVEVTPAPYLPYAYGISGFNHILALDAFIKGQIVVQDVSSMLVAEVANPKKGDYVIECVRGTGEAKAFTWVTKWKATELWMPGM